MVDINVERAISASRETYWKKRGGICRILQLVILVCTEVCLAVHIGNVSQILSRTSFIQLVLLLFPTGSVLCFLVAHLNLGSNEDWPQCQRCSWLKVELGHDCVIFILLLQSALVLFLPPAMVLQNVSAALSLVTAFLVVLGGVEVLRTSRNMVTSPLVDARTTNNVCSPIRGMQLESANSPTGSVIQRQSSTPMYAFSLVNGEKINNELSDTQKRRGSILGMPPRYTESSFKISPISINRPHRMESPMSPPAMHPRVNVLRSFGIEDSLSKDSWKTKNDLSSPPFSNSYSCLSEDSLGIPYDVESPERGFICTPSLRQANRTSRVTEPNEISTRIPTINFIEPSPVTNSFHNSRTRLSVDGGISRYQESYVMSPSVIDFSYSDSPMYNHTDAESIDNHEPVPSRHSQDKVLVNGSSVKLAANNLRHLSSFKSMEDFSSPETYFSAVSSEARSASPQALPRKIVPMVSAPLPYQSSSTTSSPPQPLPRISRELKTSKLYSSDPPLSRNAVQSFHHASPYHKNLRNIQSMPQAFHRSEPSTRYETSLSHTPLSPSEAQRLPLRELQDRIYNNVETKDTKQFKNSSLSITSPVESDNAVEIFQTTEL